MVTAIAPERVTGINSESVTAFIVIRNLGECDGDTTPRRVGYCTFVRLPLGCCYRTQMLGWTRKLRQFLVR